jgi:signal transduction histidine kinase/ligand-binding sensor domain-containing protein
MKRNRACRDIVSARESALGRLEQYHVPTHRTVLIAFFGVFLAFVPAMQAQYRATQWNANAGLPQNIVRGIVQMPDGYLWIATLNGIARFDGVRFTVFDKSNTPGITTNRIAALARGTDGDLWLCGENGSITRYHKGIFSLLGMPEGVPTNSVKAITSDNAGNVWILSEGRILKWNNSQSKFESVSSDGAIHYDPLNWVATGFWGLRGRTLSCFAHGRFSSYDLPEKVDPASLRKVAVGGDGVVWLSLPNEQFARLINGKWLIQSSPVVMPFIDPTRQPWKAIIGSQLDRVLVFPSEEMDKGIRYNQIVDDDEHNVWVGAEGQGLYRIDKQTIHTYSVGKGLISANVYPVLSGKNGDMWVGSWPTGLTQFHEGKTRTYTTKDGVPGLPTALAEDHAGNLWIGTHSGLAVLSEGHIHTPPNLPPNFPDVQAILETRDDALLLGTPEGLYRYSPRDQKGTWLKSPAGVDVGDVRVIVESADGDIWFGGYGGLTKMHNGAMTRWTEREGLPSDSVRAIYQDPQGVIWVGTYDGGLGRFANGQWTHYNEANGLFDNGVFQILEDHHANLWMSSNRGIYRVSKKQLNDLAAGRESNVITVSYGRSDGMLTPECNGGLWPAGAVDKQGHLWFPTQDGVAVVDPDIVSVSLQSPKIVVESATIDHVPTDLDKPITISPGQESLEIAYTALSFYRPDQIVFRYKMDGLDSKWQNVGYRRTAYFAHMPPGKYTFRMMAANSEGIWNEAVGLKVTVLPPFYLTGWFVAATLLLISGIIYALWSFRVGQLRAIQAAQQAFSQELIYSQESERRRISAELHDSLGQRLILIKNHALILLRLDPDAAHADERRQAIEDITTEASHAIDETRAISYNLRPFQLDRLGLSKAIEALVKSTARATEIEFTARIDDIDDSFPEDLRINFYRIVQEAVNNIVKHSEASEAEIRAEKTSNRILLSISDNGNGRALEAKSPSIGKGGFGMTGIRERATVLGGVVKIRSHPGFGTLLTCEFDLTKFKKA